MNQENAGASRKDKADLFTMGEAAGEAVKDLITQHWPMVEGIILTTRKKQAVSVSLKFTPIAEQTYKLETSIRFAEKHSDEREDIVGGDPKQQKLGIEELRKGAK